MTSAAPRWAEVVRDELGQRSPDAQWGRADIRDVLRRIGPVQSRREAESLVDEVTSHLLGLGPLDQLLAEPDVTDVLVNGTGRVVVERAGTLVTTDLRIDAEQLAVVVERLVAPSGTRVDATHPIADARLADGTRVCVVASPPALNGPVIALRRFVDRAVPLGDMAGGWSDLLVDAVRSRRNVVVFGGTGAGKTTLLNALASSIDPTERVLVIEDTAELRLPLPHVVHLEARTANAEGAGRISIADLVRAALRLRPDRIVVGEVRGAEAADLLTALSTGHEGGLSTCHAGDPVEALDRLHEMALMVEGASRYAELVRSRLYRAVDVLVGVRRRGAERVVHGVWVVDDDGRLAALPPAGVGVRDASMVEVP